MSLVVEPSVTAEKLSLLLAEGSECPELDYKSTLALRDRPDEIELAKDIAAIQARGGYIVIGANDDGTPSGAFGLPADNIFDESILRKKMEQYFSPLSDLRIGIHTLAGFPYVLIYIGPNTSGVTVMTREGSYREAGKKYPSVIFRPGDVFVRHGSSSERWAPEDVAPIIDQLIHRRKEAWRRENVDAMIAAVKESTTSTSIARAPAAAFSWQLDTDTMRSAFVELVRTGDLVPPTLLLDSTSVELQRLLDSAPQQVSPEYIDLLDRICCLLSVSIHLGVVDIQQRAMRAFRTVYGNVDVYRKRPPTQGKDALAARMWLEIVARVEAAGALSVRMSDWSIVRALVFQRPPIDDMRHYPTWTRHALVMSNRAEVHRQLDGQDEFRSTRLVLLTQALVEEHTFLRPDCPPQDERSLDSILEYDFMACLMLLSQEGDVRDWPSYYTNFAFWYPRRLTPVVERLIRDLSFRRAIVPENSDDAFLAAALDAIQRTAMATSGGPLSLWDDWESDVVAQFIRENRSKTDEQ